MGEVEAPDQIAVGFDAVGVVDVRGLQKAQEVRGGGLDHFLQPIVRIGVVADENHRFDAGLFAFLDFENQIDAIVRPFDDFRHHLYIEAPVAVIDLEDTRDVGLHCRARQRTARFGLDFLLELLVLDLGITLEGEPIDDRRFDHRYDEPAARLGDADVLEQARGVKRLEGGVDFGGIDALARAGL